MPTADIETDTTYFFLFKYVYFLTFSMPKMPWIRVPARDRVPGF